MDLVRVVVWPGGLPVGETGAARVASAWWNGAEVN